MGYEVKMMEDPVSGAGAGGAVGAALPPGAVMADRAAGWLRAYLCRRGLRRRPSAAVWQVVCGAPWRDGEKLPRDGMRIEDLILSDAVRERLEAEVVGFFAPRAAELYRKLAVRYRRGVLLYGPPGNGK